MAAHRFVHGVFPASGVVGPQDRSQNLQTMVAAATAAMDGVPLSSSVHVAPVGSHQPNGRVSIWTYAQEFAARTATFLQEVPAELVPVVGHMCKAFLAFEQLVETAKSNQEALYVLRELCDVVIKGVLVPRANRPDLTKEGFLKLKEHVDKAGAVATLCNGGGSRERAKRFLLSRKISSDIAAIRADLLAFCSVNNLVLADDTHARVDDLANTLVDQLDAMKQHTITQAEYGAMEKRLASRIKELEDMGRASWELEVELRDCKKELTTINAEREERNRVEALARSVKIPAGAPRIRDWYAERTAVVNKTCGHLGVGTRSNDYSEGPRVIGLAGPSGAGKSTVASMVIARADVRASFHKGVLWLQVGKEAKDRLPELMTRLAGMVYETVMQKGCRPPRQEDLDGGQEDGGAYIREVVDESSRRFLVVADNVWEVEVLQELKRAGVWVLYTTRGGCVLPEAPPLRVDQVLQEEAELVLRRAAELDDDVFLPEAAYDLMARSNFVVLDLALVGRWSGVRGRSDDKAWRRALMSIESAQWQGDGVPLLSWRAAVLHAGLEELACDNPKNKELYLSLAVVPKGLAFPSEVAGILLYGDDLSDRDLKAAREVAATLERWSILTLEGGGKYRVHDDHADFVQKVLRGKHVRGDMLDWWREYISSIRALVTYSSYSLVKIWEMFAHIGGDGTTSGPSILAALEAAGPSNAGLPEALGRAARFFWRQKDWLAAYKVNFDLLGIIESTDGRSSLEAASTLNSLAACASNAGWRERAEAFCRRALEIRGQILGGDHLDVAGSLYSLGVCVYVPGQTTEAEALFTRVLAIRREKLGADHLDVAQVLHALGVCAYSARRVAEAENLFRQAFGIRIVMLGAGHPELSSTLSCLAECVRAAGRTGAAVATGYIHGVCGQNPSTGYALGGYRQRYMHGQRFASHYQPSPVLSGYVASPVLYPHIQSPVGLPGRVRPRDNAWLGGNGRNREDEHLYRRALSSQEETLGPSHPTVASTLYKLGGCAAAAGKIREAEEFYRRALVVWKNDAGVHHHKLASTLFGLGGCAYAVGSVGDAQEYYEEALSVQEETLGVDHPEVAHTLCKLGSCADMEGRTGDAGECFRRALIVFKGKLGVKHPDVANTLINLGGCVYNDGRREEGEGCFRQALWIRQAILGTEHADVATALHYLGYCAEQAGRRADAEEYYWRALAIQERKAGFMRHPDAGNILYNLGFLADRAGKMEEAEAYFRRALQIQQIKVTADHPYVGLTLHSLGACACRAGRTEEAERLYRRALQIREKALGVDHPSAAETRMALAELRQSWDSAISTVWAAVWPQNV